MNAYQKHQSLVNEYQVLVQKIKKSRMLAFVFPIGVWSVLSWLKYLQVGQFYLISTILFGLLLLMRIRDFKHRRWLDQNMTRLTLEGLELEKHTRGLNFFQNSLDEFGIMRVMLQRALLDIGTLFFFCLATFRLILSVNSEFSISRGIIFPLVGLLGFFMSDLYYEPLKPLADAKRETSTN